MNERVLFVDDEPQVREGIQRSLRKQVDLRTATSGAEGLRVLTEAGPFALAVSDMRMPSMNGAQFLAKVREQKLDTVRMILSGQADLQATIAAVNEGQIYRFLSKPCALEHLLAAIEDRLNQHRLLTAEKVLLEQTLTGCVTMLIDILGMVSSAASSCASRLQRYGAAAARTLQGLKLGLGMILGEDLVSLRGIRLVASGQEVTSTLIVRLVSIAGGVGVAEPFRVRVSA